MRFQKKPIVVEAEQFLGFYHTPWPAGVEVDQSVDGGTTLCVTTTHGQKTRVESGDWIIAEPDGNGFYPCKPHIFKDVYEPC